MSMVIIRGRRAQELLFDVLSSWDIEDTLVSPLKLTNWSRQNLARPLEELSKIITQSFFQFR
ncbi:unnamed protein product [Ilex paraguariensis]|uniref:Uncharacterized protein n=1 Tax=Ilex paraguariensis TaxID=185542 RepID=A0ABC8S9N5_9AQUA